MLTPLGLSENNCQQSQSAGENSHPCRCELRHSAVYQLQPHGIDCTFSVWDRNRDSDCDLKSDHNDADALEFVSFRFFAVSFRKPRPRLVFLPDSPFCLVVQPRCCVSPARTPSPAKIPAVNSKHADFSITTLFTRSHFF